MSVVAGQMCILEIARLKHYIITHLTSQTSPHSIQDMAREIPVALTGIEIFISFLKIGLDQHMVETKYQQP